MFTNGAVIVMKVPARLNHVEAQTFLRELQPLPEQCSNITKKKAMKKGAEPPQALRRTY
jgi:hypothetical protein